ncbi:hypothetical protein C8R45DRAFT_1113746 [Mycena sanguinolenta]|nr:hypothetical protein C8R45DRAFT_1113746 [Mycena sanguinolenta]
MFSNSDLNRVNIILNLRHKVAICTECGYAVLPSSIGRHRKDNHGGQPPRAILDKAEQICTARGIHSSVEDVIIPAFGSAPVEGLPLPVEGMVCRECPYAALSSTQMRDHWASPGHKAKRPNSNFDRDVLYKPVQTFFNPRGKYGCWFEVNPTMTDVTPDHPFAIYQQTYGQVFDKPKAYLAPPLNGRAIPPLSKLTGWDTHLRPWMKDYNDVIDLMELIDLKPLRLLGDQGLGMLSSIVESYSQEIAAISDVSDFDVRTVVMECPPSNTHSTLFEAHTIQETIDRYNRTLKQLALAVLTTSCGKPATAYTFPLTVHEADAAQRLYTKLHQPEAHSLHELVVAFHSFVCLFLLKREEPNIAPRSDRGKYDCVLECFCAVSNIQLGGHLKKPADVTPLLAELKYIIRATLIYEANHRRGDRDLTDVAQELAMENIRAGSKSPFIMVTNYQRAVSALAFQTTPAPDMRVCPDGLKFTYHTQTLDFTLFKRDIKLKILELNDKLGTLLNFAGDEIPLQLPTEWKDDWSNEADGYSFRTEDDFVSGDRPWIKGLLSNKNLGLAAMTAAGQVIRNEDGKLALNETALQTVFAADSAFVELAMVLGYITTAGSRGEEFAEMGLVNSHRPRGMLIDIDGRLWPTIRRSKAKKVSVFIPSLLPSQVSELLLKYLLVVRPGIVELIHIRYGAEAASLHQRFVWATRGKVLDGDALGNLLEVHIGFKRQPWRQFLVAIQRVYLGTEKQVQEDEENGDIFAEKLSHSLQIQRTHYAVQEGQPMATDRLSRFRSAGVLWHQLLELVPDAPKIYPISYRHRTHFVQPGNSDHDTAQPLITEAVMEKHRLKSRHDRQEDLEEFGKGWMERLELVNVKTLSKLMVNNGLVGKGSTTLIKEVSLDGTPDPPQPDDPVPDDDDGQTVDALALLRQLLNNPDAQWKSRAQQECVKRALARDDRLIAVLNTGEGKSMIYLIPTLVEPNMVTVVVCPNKSLLDDQLQSCQALGIKAMQWKAEYFTEHGDIPDDISIIYVALETAVCTSFETHVIDYLGDRLARLVWDEIHQAIEDAEWRQPWQKIVIRNINRCQQLYLSASYPKITQEAYTAAIGIGVPTPLIRSTFAQPMLRFAHFRLPSGYEMKGFLSQLQNFLKHNFMGDGQGIIFRATHNDGLGDFAPFDPTCASYNGFPQRREHEAEWLAGKKQWITSTSTCYHGINNPNCNVVIMVNLRDPTMSKVTQPPGRAGRGGQESLVIFVSAGSFQYRGDEKDAILCSREAALVFNDNQHCRRTQYGIVYNGIPQSCADLPGCYACDICSPELPLWGGIRGLYEPSVPALPPARPLASSRSFAPIATSPPVPPSSQGVTGSKASRYAPYPARSPRNDVPSSSPTPAHPHKANPFQPTGKSLSSRHSKVHIPKPMKTMPQLHLYNIVAQDELVAKRDRGIALGKLANMLHGQCPTCWALTGTLLLKTHTPLETCGLPDNYSPAKYDDLTKFSLIFPDYIACYTCGFPQDDNSLVYDRTAHKKCRLKYALKEIAFAVRHHRVMWPMFAADFDLEVDMSVDDFGRWLTKSPDLLRRWFNGAELMYWVLKYHESKQAYKKNKKR